MKYGITTIYDQARTLGAPAPSTCPCNHGRPCPFHVSPHEPAWAASRLAAKISAELLANVTSEDDSLVE